MQQAIIGAYVNHLGALAFVFFEFSVEIPNIGRWRIGRYRYPAPVPRTIRRAHGHGCGIDNVAQQTGALANTKRTFEGTLPPQITQKVAFGHRWQGQIFGSKGLQSPHRIIHHNLAGLGVVLGSRPIHSNLGLGTTFLARGTVGITCQRATTIPTYRTIDGTRGRVQWRGCDAAPAIVELGIGKVNIRPQNDRRCIVVAAQCTGAHCNCILNVIKSNVIAAGAATGDDVDAVYANEIQLGIGGFLV